MDLTNGKIIKNTTSLEYTTDYKIPPSAVNRLPIVNNIAKLVILLPILYIHNILIKTIMRSVQSGIFLRISQLQNTTRNYTGYNNIVRR